MKEQGLTKVRKKKIHYRHPNTFLYFHAIFSSHSLGMNREIAELHYIVEAMQLDGYGMEFYAVKDEVCRTACLIAWHGMFFHTQGDDGF